jgi:8-oxo-dGTP diphosphatase
VPSPAPGRIATLPVSDPGGAAAEVGGDEDAVLHEARSPQLIALACVVRTGQVLLVKHSYDLGLWGLPGGMVEPGESTEDAAIREVREETGLEVVMTGLLAIGDRGDRLIIVHGADVVGGEVMADPGEIEEVRWFSRDDLAQVNGSVFALGAEIAALATAELFPTQLRRRTVSGPDGSHGLYAPAPEPRGR